MGFIGKFDSFVRGIVVGLIIFYGIVIIFGFSGFRRLLKLGLLFQHTMMSSIKIFAYIEQN